MNADGTGATQIKTGLFDEGAENAWARTQNVLAYWTTGGQWRKINADGTGDTLLATDPNPFFGLTRNAWAPDDSAVFAMYRNPASADPKGTLHKSDAAGGGATSLGHASYANLSKHLPHVFNQRVYWALHDTTGGDDDPMEIVSCALNGTDYRVEVDLTTPPSPFEQVFFRGFDNLSG